MYKYYRNAQKSHNVRDGLDLYLFPSHTLLIVNGLLSRLENLYVKCKYPPPPPPPILKSNLDPVLEKWNVYGVDVDSPVNVGFGRNGRILWPPRSTLEGVWNVGGGGDILRPWRGLSLWHSRDRVLLYVSSHHPSTPCPVIDSMTTKPFSPSSPVVINPISVYTPTPCPTPNPSCTSPWDPPPAERPVRMRQANVAMVTRYRVSSILSWLPWRQRLTPWVLVVVVCQEFLGRRVVVPWPPPARASFLFLVQIQ